MPGGVIRYVPLHPPKDGATRTSSAAEWTIDFEEFERTINSKTKMIVSWKNLMFHNLDTNGPVGPQFTVSNTKSMLQSLTMLTPPL